MTETEESRKRYEAAMINDMQPDWNTANKESFKHDKTTVRSSGHHQGVPAELTVDRTE